MIAQNKAAFDALGITRWHEAGYTGKHGISITYERFEIPARMAGKVETLWGDVYKAASAESESGLHGIRAADVFLQVAPDRKLYQIADRAVGKSGVYTGFLVDTLIPWMIANRPDTGYRSLSDTLSGFDEEYAETLSFCSLFNSAGNEGGSEYAARIDDYVWFGVGAVTYRNGEFSITYYSSEADAVDCCGLANVEVETNVKTTVTFTGTSCAAPMVAGMCALVNDYMIQHIGRPLSHDEMYQFITANCRDIHTAGTDKKTGYGLFILPDPDSIDLSVYLEGKMMAKTNTGLVEYARAQLGRPYWWGTFGQLGSETLYQQLCSQPHTKAETLSWTKASYVAGYGKKVHDCIGLVKGYLFCDDPDDSNPNKNYKGAMDVSADGMLAICTEKGPVSTIPDMPGVLVFMTGHVGVYIGDGEVIEARGHAYGVVQTRLRDRPWVNWGKCPYITYQEVDDMTGQEIYAKLNEYLRSQEAPAWAKAELQEAIDAGITDGTEPMVLIPRYQAAIMALRASKK